MKKLQKGVIALNIFNIIILITLIIGVFFAVFAVTIICALFGPNVMKTVFKQLFANSLILNVPNLFIVVVTIVSLAMVLCKKQEKIITKPKRIDVFLTLHIVCLVLTIICMVAPVCLGISGMISDALKDTAYDWSNIWAIIVFACLEGFSLLTNIFDIKYLNELKKKTEGE